MYFYLHSAVGKTAWVTGASSGIGWATAVELAKRGANLVISARRTNRLQELASKLGASGTKVIVAPCDVTKYSDCQKAVEAALQNFGQLDLVFANAGFGVVDPVDELNIELFRKQFETNVFGVLNTYYASAAQLQARGGYFASTGSVMSYLSLPRSAAYSMSKAAVKAFSDTLYLEAKEKGFSVTLISPGLVDSEIWKVDNDGKLIEGAQPTSAQHFRMPAPRAARKIVSAILSRRREYVVTFHAKIIVLLCRYFPNLVFFLLSVTGVRSRAEPEVKNAG